MCDLNPNIDKIISESLNNDEQSNIFNNTFEFDNNT